MPKFKHHIFICTNERSAEDPRGCCKARGSEKIREFLKDEVKRRGLKGTVRANAAGCLDHCELGPVVVVYPEGIWYRVPSVEDAREILESHIEGGKIVERLAIYPENR
ncbi:MAG TPA: (2Fe-2S) ferredoxin domain-containing protein [bacterium]|nr:(2Fe-2S) ferredoxin domain-containing protein [bacterium]